MASRVTSSRLRTVIGDRPQFRIRDPLGAIFERNVKAKLEAMLYREAKFIRPSLPDLTLAVNSTAGGSSIRILFRYVVESLRMLAIDRDSFGNHRLTLDFLCVGIVEIVPIIAACVFEAAPIKPTILGCAHVTKRDH